MLELSCKANAIELARIAEPQPIMSKKSTRYVGAFVARLFDKLQFEELTKKINEIINEQLHDN